PEDPPSIPEPDGHTAIVLEAPDQAADQGTDDSMVEIARAEIGERPAGLLQEQPFESAALSGQHLFDVLDGFLERFDIVGKGALERGGDADLGFLARRLPGDLGLAAGDRQASRDVAE